MTKKLVFTVFIILSVSICNYVFCQEVTPVATSVKTTAVTQPEKQRFNIGAGYWYTWGKLDSYVYADEYLYGYVNSIYTVLQKPGDKISELNNTIDSGMAIVNAEAWIWWRFYIDGFVGWGNFDGDHKDSDWVFPQIISDRWSLSKSDAIGKVTTWNANFYLRVLEEKDDKGYFDLSAGYIYYRDDIEHLKNSTLVIYDWTSVDIPIAGHDSSDRYTVDGVRLGARGKIRLCERVALVGAIGLAPWSTVKDKGYWNLREMKIDAKANTTFYDINGGVEFKITKNIFIEGGYKYMSFDSDKGDDTRTWADGTKYKFKDAFAAKGHRGGFYAMGRLKF